MAAMSSTAFTCPNCHETLRVDVQAAGQERKSDGTVRVTLRADVEAARAHVESHRP